jgi:single-strand DNA-binding protein
MLCKNRITLIGFLGQHAETRSTPNGAVYTRFSLATSVSWKEKNSDDYKTRTEWHRVVSWNKLGAWAGALQKGAYVEVEGELRYREFTPAESDRSVRMAALMNHLKEVDSERTVLMVQVENETGTWGGTIRDYSPEANKLFNGPVPPEVSARNPRPRERVAGECDIPFRRLRRGRAFQQGTGA